MPILNSVFGNYLNTYNLKNVSVQIGGVALSGFGENDAVSIDAAEEIWTTSVGADGEVVRSKNNNATGTITITCMQTSGVNEICENIRLLDEAADQTGLFLLPIIIFDEHRNETISSEQCWLMSHPTRSFGKRVAEREFVFAAPNLSITRGSIGNVKSMLAEAVVGS